MDFAKSKIPKNTNNELNTNKSHSNMQEITKSSDPLNMLEEQIKILININLSPLPTIKEDLLSKQNELSVLIKKIVFYIDEILMSKLKSAQELNTQYIRKDSEFSGKLYSKDSLKENSMHYWDYISKHFQIPSVKFINNICDNIQSKSEKGLTWLCISILENSLLDTLKEIYLQKFEIKYYENDSLLILKKETLLEKVEKILKLINIYDTSQISTYRDYIKYKQKKEKEKFTDYSAHDYGIELPSHSLNKIESGKSLGNSNGRNSDVSPINKMNSNAGENFIYTPLNLNVLQSKFPYDSAGNERKNLRTLDNLINFINKDSTTLIETNPNNIEDHHDNVSCVEHEETEEHQLNEKAFPRRILKVNNMAKIAVHLHKQTNQNGKIQLDEEKSQHLIRNYNIIKFADVREGYKENYFSFKSYIEKGLTRQTSNHLLANTKLNNKMTYPFEKNFVIISQMENKKFTKNDIILVNNQKIAMTNSIFFFLKNYYNKVEFYKFDIQIFHISKPITIDMQNYQCFLCYKIFESFLGIPFSKIYWCSYFNRWVCRRCISEEHSIIPAFILKDWSFKKFPISKKAREILAKWYRKPVIYIKNRDKILKISTLVRVASIYKRKIHKMFDLMKCEDAEKIILEILGDYNYLVLKEILFSLKDLCDINDGNLIFKMREWMEKLSNHLTNECKICDYRGGKCMMCLSDEIILGYDVENVLYCYDCKKIFHRKCSAVHPCIINR